MGDQIKPGYQTTEFWLSLAAAIVGAVMSSGIIPDTSTVGRVLGLAAMILSAVGYTVSRTILKK